jgi:hypothetical protein
MQEEKQSAKSTAVSNVQRFSLPPVFPIFTCQRRYLSVSKPKITTVNRAPTTRA